MADHNGGEREVIITLGFVQKSKEQRRVRTQMVNFCRGGCVVPPAQAARLPAGLGTDGRSPAPLQGTCLSLFPPYRGEKKGFASARFCHPTAVFPHSRSCNLLLQATASVWPKGVFPAWNRVTFSQAAHSVFSQRVLGWPQSLGELSGSKPVPAVAAGQE